MKRSMMVCSAAALVSLALGGCPSTKQADPQPGTVTVLTAGSYSGSLACGTVDSKGVQKSVQPTTADVLVTADGGLRLYADNIAPGITLSQNQLGVTQEETIGQITETTDTVTIPTTGDITAGTSKILTSRTVTLKQVDAKTIQMTDSTDYAASSPDDSFSATCTGTISQ